MDKIEIARSYSEKISLGNYCMADFFASAKCEAGEGEGEEKSKELFDFCREQVKKDIEEYKKDILLKKEGGTLVSINDQTVKELKFTNVKIDD